MNRLSEPEAPSIVERLETLEKQNRTMKRVLGIIIVMAASLLLMGQVAAKRTFDGTEFLLRDGKGVIRAKWTVTNDGPQLLFLDPNGNTRAELNGNAMLSLSGPPDQNQKKAFLLLSASGFAPASPTIFLGSNEGERGTLHVNSLDFTSSSGDVGLGFHTLAIPGSPTVADMFLNNKGSRFDLQISDKSFMGLDDKDGNTFEVRPSPASISIKDKEGFHTVIGSVGLNVSPAGQTIRTSAASIALFDKNGAVLWRAPIQP